MKALKEEKKGIHSSSIPLELHELRIEQALFKGRFLGQIEEKFRSVRERQDEQSNLEFILKYFQNFLKDKHNISIENIRYKISQERDEIRCAITVSGDVFEDRKARREIIKWYTHLSDVVRDEPLKKNLQFFIIPLSEHSNESLINFDYPNSI